MTARTVLVVDDERALRRVIARALDGAGYRTLEAASGEEACELLRAEPVDVLLVDLRMPGMSGQTLFHAVSAEWPELTSRVIVMSGDPDAPDTAGWLDYHRLPVLPKPFDVSDLLAAVALRLHTPKRANGAG